MTRSASTSVNKPLTGLFFFFLLVAAMHKFELLVEFSTMTIFVDPRDIFNSGESVFFYSYTLLVED